MGWKYPPPRVSGGFRWPSLPFVILFMLFPISRPVWHLLPEMPFLQYPWRWLEALEAPMGIFFAAAIWPASRRARLRSCRSLRGRISGGDALRGDAFFQVCYAEDTVASTLAAYHSGAGFEGMYEYAPPGSDLTHDCHRPSGCVPRRRSVDRLGKPNPDDPNANPTWSSEQPGCLAAFPEFDPSSGAEHLRFHATMDRAGFLVLRLLSFPAWTGAREWGSGQGSARCAPMG